MGIFEKFFHIWYLWDPILLSISVWSEKIPNLDTPYSTSYTYFQDDITENKYDNLWTEALHAWANTKHPNNLFRYLNETMNTKQSATYMWVAMTHLTPSALDVVWNLAGGLREMNDKISK